MKLILLFNTIKYLKPTQIYYRIFYVARNKIRKVAGFTYPLEVEATSTDLALEPSIVSYSSYENNRFTFLNFSTIFDKEIDWNYKKHGKLWTYNLTYFDYLFQENMTKETGLMLMNDFIDNSHTHKDALEPFPIALRGINWIKFLVKYQTKDAKIDNSLYAQYKILVDNLEYHLLGNHLLENGFSLLFAAYYFQDPLFYAKAKKILTQELEEQILSDGAHFELSPMYHQIMLFRVLDCINLVTNNNYMNKEMETLLVTKAKRMLAWLKNITFEGGEIPLFNDSTKAIAPTTSELLMYAKRLNIDYPEDVVLNESGYRKIKRDRYECIVDVGKIGPDYIPGHAHADTFSFELYIDSKPFIVDTGLSTYETNERRFDERSTSAHNTVEVSEKNSSNVWGGFRVAERSKITYLEEKDNKITATHDGYKKKMDILHTRYWAFEMDKITIKDNLSKNAISVARLHFHPDITEPMIQNSVSIQNNAYKIKEYKYADEFNKCTKALVMEIELEKEVEVKIKL
ncbi:MAG: heparinase II/III family protein [Sulfurovum sp.]|nr:heparinase II/III family protein [Sulfurovum sp.]